MAAVRLDHVVKRYGDVLAVDNLSLDVLDGEFLVLVGPSGCGKSTALRLIAGLEEITAGHLYIGDRLVNQVSPKDRDIAMVFQSYALYPHMSVYDNMAFGLKLRKLPKTEIQGRVRAVADVLGLGELLARKPGQLSGGQRQRVALGRAIVREPRVFLMDEPLSNLDAQLRVQTRAELIKLHQRLGTTTIYVTHDQVEAMTMGQRIAVMRDGVLQQLDTPQVLYDHPSNQFVASFLGSPSMNFLPGQLVQSEGTVWIQIADWPRLRAPDAARSRLAQHAGADVIFGIRPEHVHHPLEARGPTEGRTTGGTAVLVEPLGSTVNAYLQVGSQEVVAVMDAVHRPTTGERLDVVIDTDRLHVFDASTGQALG